MKEKNIKNIVKENYSKIAQAGVSCNCGCGLSNSEISKEIGYFQITILNEDKIISEKQYQKLPVESLKLKAIKICSSSEKLLYGG